MNNYKNILVAVELKEAEDKLVLKKALEIAKCYDSTLFLVHAVEHFSNFATATAGMAIVELEEMLNTEHKAQLEALAKAHSISDDNIYLCVGSIAGSVHDVAKKTKAGLVVTGTHTRHGLALLFGGNTTDAIIHRSDADVLTVHLPRK
jgi:universal stress protein A